MSTAQGERRLRLAASRLDLNKLPCGELFELPGRPHVVYQLRNYGNTANPAEAALQARNDAPFLFRAFEVGQVGPKRLARMHGDKPRVATIHEYLDWTVTAQAAEGDDELDFAGFRVLVILPRYRSGWPSPEDGPGRGEETPRIPPQHMGAAHLPMPILQTHGKPVTAATIRTGPGYLEVPFVATHENKRGRGYCRCMVEAIEQVARALGMNKLMLCSTNDTAVKSTWRHLGFEYASDDMMESWDILHTDLVYLQNTTQMHKDLLPPLRFKSVVIKHEHFKQRSYAFVGYKRAAQQGGGALTDGATPSTKHARLNSKRSESVGTSRDESHSVMVQDTPMSLAGVPMKGCAGAVDGRPHGGPAAAGSAAGGSGAAAHHAHHPALALGARLEAAALEDYTAGGGPPTPPPADGGPVRLVPGHSGAVAAMRHYELQPLPPPLPDLVLEAIDVEILIDEPEPVLELQQPQVLVVPPIDPHAAVAVLFAADPPPQQLQQQGQGPAQLELLKDAG